MPITSPFGHHSTALEVAAGHDLAGKTALITGASSGLGVETARVLLLAGASVILAVRDVAKTEPVAAELRALHSHAQVDVVQLDLGSLASVHHAASEVLARWPKLDLLINNAGVMATPFSQTQDGFEMQFGTNHLGHFLLSTLLLPALRAAGTARLVSLSSIGHRRSDLHFDDLHYQSRPYEKWGAYGQSKTANILFAVGWQQRYGAEGITANALHPGGISTGLQKFIPIEEQQAMGWIDAAGKVNSRFKSIEQGAATSIWAALGQELEGVGGLYLEDCNEALPFDPARPYGGYKSYALDPASAERLWQVSLEMVGS
jgi:NAD(P)-dependent dehydrogenase (short-subunit alcohol dehydrogenase family)